MLAELTVENYAVVERARIRFHPGFNLLTGETGSGKSIVVGALGLVFGGRASADVIRSGADRARVSAIFEVSLQHPDLDPAGAGEDLLIEREVQANGKSRAWINSRPVTAALLRELAPQLGLIHGQHDQQALFDPAAQLDELDSFGGLDAQRKAAAAAYREWNEALKELADLEGSERERLRQADLWAFQRNEIEAAAPRPGEDAELEAERARLSNITKLSGLAAEAYSALYESPESAASSLRMATRRLEELCRIEPSLESTLENLRAASVTVQDASRALEGYLGRLEADPARLDAVESRLSVLDKLKRKYGITLDEVLAHLAEVTAALERAGSAEERARKLRSLVKERRTLLDDACLVLHDARLAAARRLEAAVERELGELAMQRTRFLVSIVPADPSPTGGDAVTFLISPNAGEEPRPMERVLSGGELSRLALALKCVAEGGSGGRTLVFDEVDAGIGGSVAEAVGQKLRRIATNNQVLCVTHLAQIAAFGDHHFTVEKVERNGRTVAEVTPLEQPERIREIARMLAGNRMTPEALRHAEQLLSRG
jgi:DNA repair protein RecN (Recombination protein N)